MATLTTAYQMLAQKYLGSSYGDLYVRIYAKYSEQDIANNKSKVQYQARAYFSGNWIRDNQGTGNVAGTSATTVTGACTYPQKGETVIATTEAWVTHGSDGKKTISASAYLKFPNWGWSGTASGTAELPTIPRQASLTAAPNFSDEGNPTIVYSNPAGNIVESLQACIASNDGKTVYVPYRDISKTETSYTFELTEDERNALRNVCSASKSMTVKFFIKTVIGDNTLYSSLAKTLSIINADPIITAHVKDTNAIALALTGSENKLIKGFNNVLAEMSAMPLKGATIVNHKITNGGKTISAESCTFENVSSASFVFEVTDSRGNTASESVDLTLVNYVALTVNISAKMTPEGVINIATDGNYFNDSFGSAANTLEVQYRFKEQGAEYGGWIGAEAVKKGNTYTSDIIISDLDYKKRYVIQVRAIDKLDVKESVEKIMTCLPIFDWGEEDFNFNVPINVEGAISVKGTIITDFVVEQGTSGIWTYRKWNSGIAECWGITESATNSITTSSGTGYYKDSDAYDFPSGLFSAAPVVSVKTVGETGLIDASVRQVSSDYVTFRYWASVSLSWTGTTHIIANGKWKE